MLNKIFVVVLSMIIGLILVPIINTSVDNAQTTENNIEFSITSTSEVITTDLTENQLKTIIDYADNISTVSNLLLDSDVIDPFSNLNIPETINYEETETVVDMVGQEILPFTIHAGDYLIFNRTNNTINNIAYYETYMNDNDDGSVWGFRTRGTGHSVYYNDTYRSLEGGTWDSHSFVADFTDEWLDWSTVGDVGTLTFLKDWEYELVGIYASSNPTVLKYSWSNSTNISVFADLYITTPADDIDLEFDTATLSLNVGDYSITSDTALKEGTQTISLTYETTIGDPAYTLLNILPMMFVIILVVGSVVYIKLKK